MNTNKPTKNITFSSFPHFSTLFRLILTVGTQSGLNPGLNRDSIGTQSGLNRDSIGTQLDPIVAM